ncbi:MAG: RNA helicase, partial [Spirochaetaceae bacterium]|nr:RNA helicase [Spirochaetaceae bacterium]
SATLNAWVKNLAWEYTKSPLEIEIAPETVTVDEVEQILYHVPSDDKMRFLMGIMEREKPESAIVFCNTKRYTEIVAKRLRINGIECEFIIGDLPQVKRLKIIDDIKAGRIHFLVATDVAARGLDIEGLALVVNYDLPVEAENYVHRIGRTARAGKTGKAITLASEQDVYELPAIEKYIGKKIPSEIAREDLYGEDKSRGMRIHTDSYDDRYDDRDKRRSDGRRREGGRSGEGRSSEPGRSRGEGRGRGEDRQSRGRGAPSPAAPGTSGELSRLSFDERMAYYKQKYDSSPEKPEAAGARPPRRSGQRPPAAGETGGGEGASAQKSRRRNRSRHQEAPRTGEGRNAGQGRGGPPGKSGPNRAGEKPLAGKGPAKQPPGGSVPSRTGPEKPGLLARITGLFKKPRGGGPSKGSK